MIKSKGKESIGQNEKRLRPDAVILPSEKNTDYDRTGKDRFHDEQPRSPGIDNGDGGDG